MQTKHKIIGLVVIAIVAIVAWLALSGGLGEKAEKMPEQDPAEAVLNFYNEWSDAVAGESNPYDAGLATDVVLSEDVKAYLAENKDAEKDPVLCQAGVPGVVRAKVLFAKDAQSRVQIIARTDGVVSPEQTLISLKGVKGEWQISKIECQNGEAAPEREFSFERDGFLLKSVPEPLDSRYWHLVFEEDGVMGHTAPLFFDENSMCVEQDGSEAVCNSDQFNEASSATVKGEMTEAGVSVKRLIHTVAQ